MNFCRCRARRVAIVMIQIDTKSVMAAQTGEKLPNHRICQMKTPPIDSDNPVRSPATYGQPALFSERMRLFLAI